MGVVGKYRYLKERYLVDIYLRYKKIFKLISYTYDDMMHLKYDEMMHIYYVSVLHISVCSYKRGWVDIMDSINYNHRSCLL